MNYIIYNTASGAIARSVHCLPADIDLQCSADQSWIEGPQTDDTLSYIRDGEIVARPDFEIVVNDHEIAGVPAGALLTIEGIDYTADGSIIEFEPSISGTYSIAVKLFPFRDTIIEVQA